MRSRFLKLSALTIGATALISAAAPGAWAQDAPTMESVTKSITDNAIALNLLWVVIGAVLVIFMQAASRSWRPASAGPSTPPTW